MRPVAWRPFGSAGKAAVVPQRRQRGSVSVLTAGTLVLTMVLTMVSVDLLRALQAKGRAEAAADAAALAAAQEIAVPSGLSPTQVAAGYAERNGATLLSCTCEPRTSEAIAEVQVVATFLFLGPNRVVTAAARAVIEPGGGRRRPSRGTRDPPGQVALPR